MNNILDPRFKYIPASKTDIAATFRRIRRQQKEQAEREKAAEAEVKQKVRRIAAK